MPREAKDAAMCTFESVPKSDKGEDLNLKQTPQTPNTFPAFGCLQDDFVTFA